MNDLLHTSRVAPEDRSLLRKRLLAELDRCEVLSLDIFDTAIHRRVGRPVELFTLVTGSLLTHPTALENGERITAFPELRIAAERRARELKVSTMGTTEVTLAEIYAALATSFGPSHEPLLALLRDAELRLEKQVAYANPFILELATEARERGKQVVFCSDMYLDSATLSDLLRSTGYTGFERVFVSSEHRASKHDGGLFGIVERTLGVSATSILHVGDNVHADLENAARAGWHAYHLPYTQPADVESAPSLPGWGCRARADERALTLVAGLKRHGEIALGEALRDPWVAAGYQVFGPLLTGHAIWLAESLRRLAPDRALFLARDAHLMLELYRTLAAREGLSIPVEYVYASRASLLLASFTDFRHDRVVHLFSGRAVGTVRRVLTTLGLEPELHGAAIKFAGFPSMDTQLERSDARMERLLCSLYQPLLTVAQERRALCGEYLRNTVGDAKEIAIVDIGWTGNMQASLLRLLGSDHNERRLTGLYLGISGAVAPNRYPGHRIRGWLWQDGQPHERLGPLWGGGVELLEFALSAPHGSTLGYRRNAVGIVEPVLEANAHEGTYLASADGLQRGVRLFFDAFLAVSGGVPLEALESERWADEFFRLTSDPTDAEAALFGPLTHSDSAGDTQVRIPLAAELAMDADRDATQAELQRCFWPAGFRLRNSALLARHGLA